MASGYWPPIALMLAFSWLACGQFTYLCDILQGRTTNMILPSRPHIRLMAQSFLLHMEVEA